MEFWTRTIVKAGRKDHRCENCRQPIERGASSVVIAGKHDGDFSSYRVHPECDDLWNQVFRDLDEWDYGMDIDTLEAMGGCLEEVVPMLEGYASEHPIAVSRLMVTVEQWKADRAAHEPAD